ncbi:uncharacterized protein LOC144439176 [Glandiceps talaboti]
MLNLSAFQICDLSRGRKSLTMVVCPIMVLYCCLYMRYISSTVRRQHMDEDRAEIQTFHGNYPEYKKNTDTDYQKRLAGIFERFPWIERKQFTPNELVRRSLLSTPEEKRNTTIVFVHNQKAGGSTIKTCLKQMVQEKTFARCYGVFDRNGPGNIMSETDSHRGHRKCYVGESSFGICDDFDNPQCSYFAMLREPYDRIISCYEYCKTAIDPLCDAGEATEMTLKEWAIQQGSYFFRQLLFRPTEICKPTDIQKQLLANLRNRDSYSNTSDLSSLPCWYQHKVLLESALTDTDKNDILQYTLENLENWFGVIGITEDFPTSLKVFQLTYDLPFYDLCSKMLVRPTDYEMQNAQLNETKASIIQTQILELESDTEVRDALYFDLQIYKKFKQIFNQQKDFLLSSSDHSLKSA